MQCPVCGKTKSRVLETRRDAESVWRKRMCHFCFKVWATREQIVDGKFPWSKVFHSASPKGRR